MAFKKGDPKPVRSGRRKGTPNKNSLRESLDHLQFDLPTEIVRLFQDPNLDSPTKIKLISILMDHVYPKLKDVEVTQPPTSSPAQDTSSVSSESLLQLVNGQKAQ